MRPGYTIDQYGSSKMEVIFVYNWKGSNVVGMACYYEHHLDIITDNLVAIFRVKQKTA